ncbi:MAG: hypothetical protein AAF959_23505 [Cyanobacteria bacterium P01_D01_bin.56]
MLGLPGEQLAESRFISVPEDEQGRGLRVDLDHTYINVGWLVVKTENYGPADENNYVRAGFLELLHNLPGGQVEGIQYAVQFETQIFNVPAGPLLNYSFRLAFTPRQWLTQIKLTVSYILRPVPDQFYLLDTSTTDQQITIPAGATDVAVYSIGTPTEGFYINGYQLQPGEGYNRHYLASSRLILAPQGTGQHRVSWVGSDVPI